MHACKHVDSLGYSAWLTGPSPKVDDELQKIMFQDTWGFNSTKQLQLEFRKNDVAATASNLLPT